LPREPGTTLWLAKPPAVGACIGGSCAAPLARRPVGVIPSASAPPPQSPAQVAQAARRGPREASSVARRTRFAYAGAVLGPSVAALLLGGAIAIAVVDDDESERVTRGVWLGALVTTAPLVALSAHLARRASGYEGVKAVRRLGWFAWGLAASDGALLWAFTFADFPRSSVLTIGAGALGAVSLLPLALDALAGGRSLRVRRFVARIEPRAGGLALRF
jgi:hypothetical protein